MPFFSKSVLQQVKKGSPLCCNKKNSHLTFLSACYFLFHLQACLLTASSVLLSRLPVPKTADPKSRLFLSSLLGRKIRRDSSAERTVIVGSEQKPNSCSIPMEMLKVSLFSGFSSRLWLKQMQIEAVRRAWLPNYYFFQPNKTAHFRYDFSQQRMCQLVVVSRNKGKKDLY